MKLLVLLFSLLTIMTLSIELYEDNDVINISNSLKNTINFEPPKKLSQEMLPAELKWQALLKAKSEGDQPTEIINTVKNTLMVGGERYILFGIFNIEQSLFVLLKNKNNEMLKLERGDVLPGEFSLAKISNNTIVFVNNDDRVEYKLFEKKQHE